MKHGLLLIHGMGSPPAEWADDALTALKTAWSAYPMLKERAFENVFEPIVVNYNDVFEKARDAWRNDPENYGATLTQGLTAGLSKAVAKHAERLINAANAGAEDHFFWTHAADVLMYRFDQVTRSAVNVKVAKQILEQVMTSGCKDWSIVAHSLGTAVTHNTLHALYNTPLDGEDLPLQTGEFRPKVLAMVANVSRVLQLPNVKVFDTKVRPSVLPSQGVCSYYLNMRHRLDPFVIPSPFEPDGWPDPGTVKKMRYQHIRIGHITEMNVHDLAHYLENPRCHVPLFRGILSSVDISDEEFAETTADFDAHWMGSAADAIRHELEKRLPTPASDWQAILELIRKYPDLL